MTSSPVGAGLDVIPGPDHDVIPGLTGDLICQNMPAYLKIQEG